MEAMVVTYDGMEETALANLNTRYQGLVIVDMETYELARTGIAEIRGLRTAVEARRKELKADALEWGRKVDGEAKRITGLLLEIEEPLKREKARVDEEKEAKKRQKEEAERARVKAIRDKIEAIRVLIIDTQNRSSVEIRTMADGLMDLAITKEEFQEFYDEAMSVRLNSFEALLTAEQNRQAWEEQETARKAEAERLEKQRQEQEAEAKRLEDVRKAEEEKNRKEREAVEAKRRKIQEEKDRAAFELAARQKAEYDAREKVEREEREKKAREVREAAERTRQDSLRPDKEKLVAYGQALIDVTMPILSDKKARAILADVQDGLGHIMTLIKTEVEAL